LNILKKHSAAIWICSAILVLIAANILNFNDMAYGRGNTQSLIVTLCYIAFWAALLIRSAPNKKVLMFSAVAAAISFVSVVLGYITNVTGFMFGGAVFFSLPFITPFFGCRTVTGELLFAYPVMLVVIAIWLAASIVLRVKLTRKRRLNVSG
jgi:hypothetical protein